MASRIHRLDSCTIDKIAAGEVIDVPASCVKELIDNSLDANATDILIEIRLGGRELIRVTDNGCGMSQEDLSACIERHSTSKLRSIEDLERISTHGFRGEALSSIVSVSKVTITSSEHQGTSSLQSATTLTAEGGIIRSIQETQAFPGTTVEVSDLFFNVPARRKFLKTPSKDTQDIIKVVTALALAAPHVSFRLIADDKQLLAVAEERQHQLLGRIRALFGEPFRQDAYEVFYSRDGFTLSGLVASPAHARSSRSGQHLIVNDRPVQSLPISYAVKNAYGTTCEDGKHPLFALELKLDPASIDVNVHPQKKEVRFADEEWVRMLVQEAVSEALFGKTAFAHHESATPYTQPTSDERAFSLWRPFETHRQPTLDLEETPLAQQFCPSHITIVEDIAILRPPQESLRNDAVPHDSLIALDIKQAMRSVLYNELNRSQEHISTELLLVPITLECSIQEATKLQEKLPALEQQGFVIREFGPQTFLVEGIPSNAPDVDVKEFLLELVHDEKSKTATEKSPKHLANMYVASMKSLRHPITEQTAHAVIKRWSEHNCPKIAPDGSPCFAHITISSLKDWIAKASHFTEEKGE
jgi:DNA mismatch repair protein MutL